MRDGAPTLLKPVLLLMVLVYKLFFLAVRQVSKPLAKAIQTGATSSDVTSSVLAAVGQGLHRMQIQVTRAAEGKLRLKTVSQLSTKQALEKGSEVLGEGIIYTVAAATVLYEYKMQAREKAAKARKEELDELRRLEASRANEARQWDEFRHLQQRITLLQEELAAVQRREEARAEREAEAAAAARAASQNRQSWLWR